MLDQEQCSCGHLERIGLCVVEVRALLPYLFHHWSGELPSCCDLDQYKALQDRIEELRLELDPDDEDDDGDVPSIVRRWF